MNYQKRVQALWKGGAWLIVAAFHVLAPAAVRADARTVLANRARTVAQDRKLALDPCSAVAQGIWYGMSEFAGLVPGIGTLAKVAIQTSKVTRFGLCLNGSRQQFSLEYLLDEVERVAGKIVDDELRNQLELSLSAHVTTLIQETENIAKFDQLSEIEQSRLVGVVDRIAREASEVELQATGLRWPVMPAAALAASLKNLAFNLEVRMLHDGQTKTALLEEIIPAERAQSIARLFVHEKNYTAFVKESQLVRKYKESRSGLYGTRYEINVKATRGDDTVYSKTWTCDKPKIRPKNCTNVSSRRNEYFNNARDEALKVREELANAFGVDYLRFKVSLQFYGYLGARSSWFFVKSQMLDRMGPNSDRSLGFPSPQEPLPYFRMITATSQLQEDRTRRCLGSDPSGVSGNASYAYLLPCDGVDPATGMLPSDSLQAWGIHPLGFIVQMATGKCLTANAGTQGAHVTVADCKWRLPPPDGNGWYVSNYAIIPGDRSLGDLQGFAVESGEDVYENTGHTYGYGVDLGDTEFSPGQYWTPHFQEWNVPEVESLDLSNFNGFCVSDAWCEGGKTCVNERCKN